MTLLRDFLLWGLVSLHVVGGAVFFRRLFPRESPWFGFIVPSLAFVLVSNFIEHAWALTALELLLPITTIASAMLVVDPRTHWRFLWFPTLIFLIALSYTLLLRCLKPDIASTRDGNIDLGLISDFCMGQTLPPDSTWLPGIKLVHYYSFPHYAASVLIRIFDLDVGTGFNISAALLNAFIYFCAAATAWRVGRRRIWVPLIVLFMMASAMSGSTAFIWLAGEKVFNEPEDTSNLFNHVGESNANAVFTKYLDPGHRDYYASRELTVPGFWGWVGSYHSTVAGQFLTLLAVYSLVEMVRRRRANFPWICGVGACLLMLVSSTWGVPIVGLFFLAGSGYCLSQRIVPENWRLVFIGITSVVVCLEPMLLYLLQSQKVVYSWDSDCRTQLAEWVIQFWPIALPWLALCFYWPSLNPAVRIIHGVAPLVFVVLEFYSLGCRMDMTGKMWGYAFGALWVVFVPTLAASRSYFLRSIFVLLLVTCGMSFCFWINYYRRDSVAEDRWHLEGDSSLRTNSVKARLLNIVSTFNHQIIASKAGWAYCESSMLASLTHNSIYATWTFHCDLNLLSNSNHEGQRREVLLNDLYSGKCANPLLFLRERNISALVIYPDDSIPDAVLAELTQHLSGEYRYEDCRDGNPPAGQPNAGIFVYRPLLNSALPSEASLAK